ncbi:DUF4394 domain-containing protein [Deinococcus gobiensis]|uniref:Putative lipoprotein n=1 Tax=Deinococcus gobiensis (strain DSM 21396 / JCM 16679 / CGMCC 1.7299 / I-0) TaxID=745776 RepID=H8GW49_DEIGI|nr:DUF4394 domain-containing protein [Deinococcus gobiensis]AFD24414.1 Putative lipoprotein [Deinococcus gobiensis I-0]
MKRIAALTVLSALVLSACNNGPVTPAAPEGVTAYGLVGGNQLATFGTANAAASYRAVSVTGLAAGEALVDLDFRNTDNRLYAATAAGKIYVINTDTGAATADGSSVGKATQAIDFNPVANRLRVVGTANDNYRLTVTSTPVPSTSPAGTVTSDGNFAYAAGDATTAPVLTAAAYTNSYNDSTAGAVPTGAATVLYTIDSANDTLVENTVGPAFSTLVTRSKLGVDVGTGLVGFDIAGASDAYMTAVLGNSTTLYRVNLSATSSAATAVSTISGVSIKALALKLPSR